MRRMADRLRELWDFDDLESTEGRFQEVLEAETDAESRAEILTQLARVRWAPRRVRRRRTTARRGRGARRRPSARRRTGPDRPGARPAAPLERTIAEAALPLFESAFRCGRRGRRARARRRCRAHGRPRGPEPRGNALVDAGRDRPRRGERRSSGSLLARAAPEQPRAGSTTSPASTSRRSPRFERALDERERDPANRAAIEIARYAVAKTLRALGRPSRSGAAPRAGGRVGRERRMRPTAGSTRSSREAMPIWAVQRKQRNRRGRLSHSYPKPTRRSKATANERLRLRQLAELTLQGNVAVLPLAASARAS